MGLDFPNPVGLAAGMDKNGDHFPGLGALGFGFVEIGTVTPLAQPGNPRPRLFRVKEHNGIINRMGFNNKGVDYLVSKVVGHSYKGVVGINIGKNKNTPEEKALNDYLICMREVYVHADYITINISSPNTPGLRNLQFGDNLKKLLSGVLQERTQLAEIHNKVVPIAVKIAPDLDDDELRSVADNIVESSMDAIVATNTTVARPGIENHAVAGEVGGLSGGLLREQSTHVIQTLSQHLGGRLPIIGVGGICSRADAREKIEAGASLLQLYTGFIYKGPKLIRDSVRAFNSN